MFIEDIEVNYDFEQEDYDNGRQTTDWSSDDERLDLDVRGTYYGSIECFSCKCVIYRL